ncbi:microtubule-associated protein 10 isoform X1 [Misgurnus anguillicaudatus]|uniref:microtubule-associated protein 10 isoform X1 n=2 Tax=Misgurnus anguillicaudatus TaxID=75329 RepID=UPI003CCF8EBB
MRRFHVPIKMSSTHETLFSLELVIDYVRLDCARGNVLDPAVGLRFLDFPTLLIYPSGREGPSSHSAYADLPAEALSQSEERDKYFFHKGKSCLFKINLDSLHNHLSSTPLYAMVLDIKDEVPKLIGSSLISLAKVTERIKKDVDKHGIGTPSSYGEKIITPLCNLMGNNIGVISLAYKIVSLGAHLIPHIPYNKVYKVGKGEQDPDAFAESAGVFNIDRYPIEMQHATVLSSVSPEGQPENKMRSDAKQPGIAAFTQTEPTKQKVTWLEMSYGNDEQDNTIFCSSPLFYSSTVKNQQESDAETCRMSNVEIESLNIEDPEDKNNELESADMHDVNKITAAKHRSTLVSSPKQQHRITEPAPSGDVIRQLPLLNALLNELSLLNGQTQHQQPVSVHPNLVWLYTSLPDPHPHPSAPGAKPKSEYQKRVAASSQSPQQRRDQSKMKGCIISPVSNSARKAGSAKKHQEKLQPKRKLKYGLTNTFRLRLQHVKIAHTKHHQCIEYEDMQQVNPQRQTLSDRKHAGKSARRGVNSDKTIETLINSFKVDTTPSEIASSKSQTKPTKNVTSMPKYEASEPTRKVRVHVPSVLSHYSDRSGRRSVSSVQSVHHGSNKTNPDLQIFSETGRADSRSSHRKILTSSSEQEYQDDFTSLDATDGFSPEPLSSPEPNQHQRNRVSSEHSNSDDGSNISKGLLVPVKADNSPHRSLKCTHVIRPRPQTSALSLSSDEDEDGSNSGHQRSGSQISGRKTPSVRRTFGRSESCDADPADESMTLSRVSVDSVVANNSVLKSFSPVEQVEAREEQDELGSLRLDRNYHHVSELMINKLPGYTL